MHAAATTLRPGGQAACRFAVGPIARGRAAPPARLATPPAAAPEQAEAAPLAAVEDCDENVLGFCSLDEGVSC
jgi:hypothetical protein